MITYIFSNPYCPDIDKTMSSIKQWVAILLLFVTLLGLFSYAAHTAFQGNTPGIDYFTFWMAGRAFFSHQDPYSAGVGEQIQIGLYGHLATGAENKMEFSYPPYALLIILPILGLSFDWSQVIWMSFNLLLLVSLTYMLFPKAPRWARLTFPFFYPFVFGLILGNFVVTISAFLLLFLRLLLDDIPPSRSIQIITGVLMAWSTAKPQFVWAFLVLFFLFSLRQRLWAMLVSFCASLAAMVVITLAIRPDWVMKWLGQLAEYRSYNETTSVLTRYLLYVLPGPAVQPFFVIILAASAAATVYLLVRWWNRQLSARFLIPWLSFITFLIHPGGGGNVSYEQLIFVVAFFIWAAGQKTSLVVASIWTAGWVLSYILNTSLIKLPPGVHQLFFLSYCAWMAWFFITATRSPGTITRQAKPA